MAELLMNSAILSVELFAVLRREKDRHLLHSGSVTTNRRLRQKP